MKNKFSFLNWYVPIALIILIVSYYVYQIGYVPDRFGWKKVTDGLTLRPADEMQSEYPSWFILQGKPGDVLEERLYVRSHHGEGVKMTIFSLDANAAYLPENGTEFGFVADEAVQKGLGAFISLPLDTLYLEPFEDRVIDFSIHIPEDAEYGNYAGGIVTDEVEDPEDLPVSQQLGSRINTRIGQRIYLEVTEDPVEKVVLMTREEIDAEIDKVSLLHTLIILKTII